MEQLYITNVTIKKVRHLKNIYIPLSDEQIKHLIFTGKNGSGKTSVVETLAGYLNNVFIDKYFKLKEELLNTCQNQRNEAIQNGKEESEILKLEKEVCQKTDQLEQD